MAKPRFGMLMDVRRCIGCHACTVACKTENRVPIGVWRTQIRYYEKGIFPNVRRFFFQQICDQCADAPCVAASEKSGVGAFFQREDGIVLIDYTKIKSKKAAELEARVTSEACHQEAVFLNPITGMPDKCTFCAHRVDRGIVPACVETCLGRARIFGDMNDPTSEISKLIATNPTRKAHADEDEDPAVLYIGLESNLVDVVEGFRQIDPQDFDTGKLSQQSSPTIES